LKYSQVATVTFGVIFSAQLMAANQSADEVTKFMRAEMQRQHIPGLTLLVSRSGKPIRTEGYGLSNLELNVPAKPESIFRSGSVGKQFTATAVMMLVEAGKVRLEDPLTKYFPKAPASWNQVTVRELLSHTAGFTDYPKDFDERKDYTEEELLEIVEAIPLAYPPGTSWSYSNLGYLTLGILIHKVTGQFYGDFLQQRIFRPLDMSTTRIGQLAPQPDIPTRHLPSIKPTFDPTATENTAVVDLRNGSATNVDLMMN
jgi:CubicO group peptidase (beta-lactamase class C family)